MSLFAKYKPTERQAARYYKRKIVNPRDRKALCTFCRTRPAGANGKCGPCAQVKAIKAPKPKWGW